MNAFDMKYSTDTQVTAMLTYASISQHHAFITKMIRIVDKKDNDVP